MARAATPLLRAREAIAQLTQSESTRVLHGVTANKRGLSRQLDQTLTEGHDLRVFALGTAASMASRSRYGRFTHSMYSAYHAMEEGLNASKSPVVAHVWSQFGSRLRRTPALAADLREVGIEPVGGAAPLSSAATTAYVAAIREAAADDGARAGARLLGHFYVRYFADLFGGQSLALPYRLALGLAADSPRHYDFGEFGRNRRESIQQIYSALNDAGAQLHNDALRDEVVAEARCAFKHNVEVYAEDGQLWLDAGRGLFNLAKGYVVRRLSA